jgi:xanthine/CO dehydrogenase XdhC/CoxF family maturation factor
LHLGTAALLDFHARHRDADALVLVTITATRGSTYRKPGAMMLNAPDDDYEGLISGGCLEGDLLQHARALFQHGGSRPVTYDMHSDADLVWGMGIGCDGVIELLLTRLQRDTHQKLFDAIRDAHAARKAVLFALVTESEVSDLPMGTIASVVQDGGRHGDDRLAALAGEGIKRGWPEERFMKVTGTGFEAMLINLVPQPAILLCGGGPDALPIAKQAESLGWKCTVVDHRQAYARQERFTPHTAVILCRPSELAGEIDPGAFDAAVIMSHHLESDAAYLRQLAPCVEAGTLPYLGVLGPVARRDRLREMAEAPDVLIHGPVGLDIGAELPESIALAVAAEIHAVFNQRDGQSLTTGPVGHGQ